MTTRLTRYLVRRASLNELAQMVERQTGVPVALSVGGVVAAKCVRAAEQFDLVMLTSDAIEKLTAAERVVAESRSTWRVRVSRLRLSLHIFERRRFGIIRNWLLPGLLAAVSTSAIAQVYYRWVDDQGRVHYSDTPVTDRPTVMFGTPRPAKPAAQSNSQSPVQSNSRSSAQSDSKAEELGAPKPESGKKARAKECADRRQQLIYLDARSVAKPVDDPERTKSRERDSIYRQNLSVYERAKATRDVHAEFIAQNCSE